MKPKEAMNYFLTTMRNYSVIFPKIEFQKMRTLSTNRRRKLCTKNAKWKIIYHLYLEFSFSVFFGCQNTTLNQAHSQIGRFGCPLTPSSGHFAGRTYPVVQLSIVVLKLLFIFCPYPSNRPSKSSRNDEPHLQII